MEYFWLIIILHAFVCAFLSMNLAQHKGYSSGAWFASGLFFGILGLIAVAGLPTKIEPRPTGLIKKCSDCAESIRKEAVVCKFCGRKFNKEQVVNDIIESLNDKSMSVRLQVLESIWSSNDSSFEEAALPHLEILMKDSGQDRGERNIAEKIVSRIKSKKNR